jgi:hypothetical protein
MTGHRTSEAAFTPQPVVLTAIPQFSLTESNQEVNNIMLDKVEEIQFVKRGLSGAVTIHGLDLNSTKYAF